MFLTTKSKYAVTAMVRLATYYDCGAISRLEDIASDQKLSLYYLEQIFGLLRKSMLVVSIRGPGGGYKLAKLPSQILIGEIVDAVSETVRVTMCKNREAGCMNNHKKCATHKLWMNLETKITNYLNSISLADIVSDNLNLNTKKVTTRHLDINDNLSVNSLSTAIRLG